ncbi:MAG: ECF transporter S component [Bacilli bacterium]
MKTRSVIKTICRVAIFGSLAVILYCVPYLQFSLPFAPSFLSIHLDEIPIFIASYAYGPLVGFLIIVIKTIVDLFVKDLASNMGIGALADFIYGCSFVLPAAFIYKYHRNFKGVLVGMLVSFISQLFASCIIGLYTIFPLYGIVYTNEGVISMFRVFDQSINSVTDIKISYEFLLPFNSIKNGIVLATTLVVYKPIRILIENAEK